MKNPILQVLLINLATLVLYTAIIGLFLENSTGSGSGGYLSQRMDSMIVLVFFHTLANLLLSIIFFILKRKQWGFGALISVPVVFIIGFSACLGIAGT